MQADGIEADAPSVKERRASKGTPRGKLLAGRPPRALRSFAPWLASSLVLACSPTDPLPELTPTPTPEATQRPEAPWQVSVVDGRDVGLQARVAISSDGEASLAYFANSPYQDGLCEEVDVNPPPRLRQPLYLARQSSRGGAWSLQTVDEPVVAFAPTGLSLAYSPLGWPSVAYTGGEPQDQYCGANDAELATLEAEGVVLETAASTSGQAASGEAGSDAGFVVGLWPALAYSQEGWPGILYKDAHFGSLQHDDLYRADAELALKSAGGWHQSMIDLGEGAGDYGALVFDPADQPVAIYAITVDAQEDPRHGVWATRQASGAEPTTVRLHSGAIFQEISAAIQPGTGDLLVAFYSAQDAAVKVRQLSDWSQFADEAAWEETLVGSNLYDEGQYVSLAFDAADQPALAYHRCRRLTSGSSACDPNDEAVVFRRKSGDSWLEEVVQEADGGSCGEYTSLAFDPQGQALLAFRCTLRVENTFSHQLLVATRRP